MDDNRVEVDRVGVVGGKTRDRLAYGVRSALLADEFGRPRWGVSMAERLGNRGLRSASRLVLARSTMTAIEKETMSC
jgi:hypothetical protein